MFFKSGNSFYTEEERDIIKSTFKGNEKLLAVLRKAFVPKVDPDNETPLVDLYNAIPFAQLSPEECKVQGMARQEVIGHINSILGVLWSVANTEPKTKEQIEEENRKNSNK